MRTILYGCFCKLGVLFVGVLEIKAPLSISDLYQGPLSAGVVPPEASFYQPITHRRYAELHKHVSATVRGSYMRNVATLQRNPEIWNTPKHESRPTGRSGLMHSNSMLLQSLFDRPKTLKLLLVQEYGTRILAIVEAPTIHRTSHLSLDKMSQVFPRRPSKPQLQPRTAPSSPA